MVEFSLFICLLTIPTFGGIVIMSRKHPILAALHSIQ